MEMTCPHCAARYRIVADSVPPQGRTVQCARCGQNWFQPGADEERRIANAAAADMYAHAGPLGEGVPDVGGLGVDPVGMAPFPAASPPRARRETTWVEHAPEERGGLGTIGWVLLFLVIALIAAGAYAWSTGMLKLPA